MLTARDSIRDSHANPDDMLIIPAIPEASCGA
jgi:hypothetical protein